MTARPDTGRATGLAVHSRLQRSQTRQELEEKMMHYLTCISEIKTQLNSLAPISVLPTESLVEVFLLTAASCRRTKFHVPIIRDWIGLTHVCKHWRAVALGCPVLWNRLIIAGPPEWMAELLSRSKELPLSIYMMPHGSPPASLHSHTPDEDLNELVLLSLRRIRLLNISMAGYDMGTSMRLLDGPAPLLKSLTVSDLSQSRTIGVHRYLDGLLQRPESRGLRRLSLTLCRATWPKSSPRDLTHLTIHSFGHIGGRATFQQLFSSLAQMPSLEIFKATGCFDDRRDDSLSSVRPPQVLVLMPHLRRMSLSDVPWSTAARLTMRLETPSLSQLCIDLTYEQVSVELFAAIARKITVLPPLISLAITNKGMPSKRSTIRAYADVCAVAKGSIDKSAMSWIDTHVPVLKISGDYLLERTSLPAFCTLLSGHGISSLILEHALPPQTTWPDIARRIPSVTDLYILNAEPTEALPTMLSTSISEGDESSAEGHAPGYVLPRLRTLTLEAAQFPPLCPPSHQRGRSRCQDKAQVGFLETLISCLAARREGGAGIERLRILHPNEMSQMSVDKLAQVVPSTEWDGVSGASALDAYRRDTAPMIRITKTYPASDDDEAYSDMHSAEEHVDE